MEQYKFIKIDNLEDIKKLVNIASSIEEGDVIVSKGALKINAKSVLGLLSLNLANGVKITYPCNQELELFLQSFEF